MYENGCTYVCVRVLSMVNKLWNYCFLWNY